MNQQSIFNCFKKAGLHNSYRSTCIYSQHQKSPSYRHYISRLNSMVKKMVLAEAFLTAVVHTHIGRRELGQNFSSQLDGMEAATL